MACHIAKEGVDSVAQSYPTTAFGTVKLTAGNYTVRMTVAGKNPASSGFTVFAGKFTLVEQCDPAAVSELPRAGHWRAALDSGCVIDGVPARH